MNINIDILENKFYHYQFQFDTQSFQLKLYVRGLYSKSF